MTFIMCIALWMFLSGTVIFCDRLGKEASLLLGPRSVEDRGRYGFTKMMKEGPRRRSGNRKTRNQLVDLIKRMRKSQEHQPTPRNLEEQPDPKMTKKNDKRNTEKRPLKENHHHHKRDKGKAAKPPLGPKTWRQILKERDELVFALMDQMANLSPVSEHVLLINHLNKHVYELETATKDRLEKEIKKVNKCHCQESQRKMNKNEIPKPRLGQRKLKRWLAEKERLLDRLTILKENIDPVEGNVPMLLHLDGHIMDLQLAGKGALEVVIAEIKKCQCQGYPEGDDGRKKLNRKQRKLIEQRDDLIYELMIQVEMKDPPSANLEAIYHLEGHIWDLEYATEVDLRSMIRNTKKCSCQAGLPKTKKPFYRKKEWENLLTERNHLVEELSGQLKAIGGRFDNYYFFMKIHMEKHQWLLQKAKVEDMEFLLEKVRNCWCQKQETWFHDDSDRDEFSSTYENSSYYEFEDRPDEFHDESGDRPDDRDEYFEPYDREYSSVADEDITEKYSSVSDEDITEKYSSVSSVTIGESSRETRVTPRSPVLEQLERVTRKLTQKLNTWDGAIETYTARDEYLEPYDREYSSVADEDIAEKYSSVSSVTIGESSRETPVTPKSPLLEQLERVTRELTQKLNTWDGPIETYTATEQLINERRALLVEREHFNKEKKDLEIQRKAFEEVKQAFELDYFTMIEEIDRKREDLMKEQEVLQLEWEAFQIQKGQFCLEMTNGREEMRKEKEDLTMEKQAFHLDWVAFEGERAAFEKERENLMVEREKHEKNVRDFDSKQEKVRKKMEKAGAKLITEKKLIDEAKSLLKKEKELLVKKSDNFTKKKTEFPGQPKDQCLQEWRKQQDTEVEYLEGKLVELERRLGRLETNPCDQ
ncbi:cytadherence high molecular weight protein 2-like [Macrobrachium nipponense]|uniref:cytadherence high molecular weight protein 2-like n=1 Tax=Macrobrachium nipponense TaxID=159736 RepID=UPI0030C8B6A4